MGLFATCRPALSARVETEQASHEGDGRHRPPPGRFALGGDAGGDHGVGGLDRLDAGVEAVEELAVEQGREGDPMPSTRHPLGLQVARQVGLIPGL